MYTVYGLEDPRDDLVYYVGMTSNLAQRMKVHYMGDSATISWITKLGNENKSPNIMILEENIEDKLIAMAREMYWIEVHYTKNESLLNIRGTGHSYRTLSLKENLRDEFKDFAANKRVSMVRETEAMVKSHIALGKMNFRLFDCLIPFLNLVAVTRKVTHSPNMSASDVVGFLASFVEGIDA